MPWRTRPGALRPSAPGRLRAFRWRTRRSRRSAGMPRSAAAFGRQIVAPRSIIAWAKSPGRSAGVIAATSLGDLLFRRLLEPMQPGHHASDIGVDRPRRVGRRRSRRSRRRYSRRSPATCEARLSVVGKPPRAATCARAGDQIAGPGIIAEPRPFREDVLVGRRGERFDASASARRIARTAGSPRRPSSAAA